MRNFSYEICGYTEKDENTGEDIITEGLKSKLEKQYQELTVSINQSQKQINSLVSEKNEEVKNKLTDWAKDYQELRKEIKNLLPDALTAGLSAAYSKKKDN